MHKKMNLPRFSQKNSTLYSRDHHKFTISKLILWGIFANILLILPPFAMPTESSIMFSDTEKEALQQALDHADADSTAKPAKSQGTLIRLDGIIYHSPTQWTVWINGNAHYPNSPATTFTIDQVSHQSITLNHRGKTVHLQVNHVYDLNAKDATQPAIPSPPQTGVKDTGTA